MDSKQFVADLSTTGPVVCVIRGAIPVGSNEERCHALVRFIAAKYGATVEHVLKCISTKISLSPSIAFDKFLDDGFREMCSVRLTEAGMQRFIEQLHDVLDQATDDRDEFTVTFDDTDGGAKRLSMTMAEGRKLADDLRRQAAKGRPIGERQRILRDARGELIAVEKRFVY